MSPTSRRYTLIQHQAALVTYVTAGFPTADESPDVMLAMEAGGAGTLTPHSSATGSED